MCIECVCVPCVCLQGFVAAAAVTVYVCVCVCLLMCVRVCHRTLATFPIASAGLSRRCHCLPLHSTVLCPLSCCVRCVLLPAWLPVICPLHKQSKLFAIMRVPSESLRLPPPPAAAITPTPIAIPNPHYIRPRLPRLLSQTSAMR